MVILAVQLDQVRLEVSTDLAEDGAKSLDGIRIEHTVAVLRHKDQVNVHLELAVSSVSNVFVFGHRPKYNTFMKRLQAYKYELKPNDEPAQSSRSAKWEPAAAIARELAHA
jgi:hypothetical protein